MRLNTTIFILFLSLDYDKVRKELGVDQNRGGGGGW